MTVPLALVVAFFTVLTIAAFSWTARGLLGVKFTLARLIIAGVIAFLIGQPITGSLGPGSDQVDERLSGSVVHASGNRYLVAGGDGLPGRGGGADPG